MRLRLSALAPGLVVALLLSIVPAAWAARAPASLAVDGQVSSPTTYSLAQLGAVTQTAVTVTVPGPGGTRQAVDRGVLLETLVLLAKPAFPALPNPKNAILRVTVTVRGAHGRRITFALGELDPNFGNHPALLALTRNGVVLTAPELVVPGDSLPLRTVGHVDQVTVGIASASASTPAAPGDVTVVHGSDQISLTPQLLGALPQQTLTVSFTAHAGVETHTETGPPLLVVLAITEAPLGLNAWAVAVGSDNYAAAVTPAEAYVGQRQLLLSLVEDGKPLAQPRLVTASDVKGGRYVSDVVDIYAGHGPAA